MAEGVVLAAKTDFWLVREQWRQRWRNRTRSHHATRNQKLNGVASGRLLRLLGRDRGRKVFVVFHGNARHCSAPMIPMLPPLLRAMGNDNSNGPTAGQATTGRYFVCRDSTYFVRLAIRSCTTA